MPNGTYGGVRGRKTKVGRKLLRFPPTRFYGAGLGRPDAAWGFAGDLLQPLPRVSSDICRKCPPTSAADPLRPLRQTSERICRRGRSTPAASLGVGLLIPRFYPRFSMNSIARAISSGVSMPMVS